jgi:hypothetical protein
MAEEESKPFTFTPVGGETGNSSKDFTGKAKAT